SKACTKPRTRTTKGASHRMRAPIQARWPRARAADMRDGTPGGRDSTVVVAPTGLRGHLPRGVAAEPGCPYDPHHPPPMPHWTPTPAGATTRPMSSSEPYDLVIAGAGMVGATFALAAAQGGLKVVVVDPQPFDAQLAPSLDGRSTAIAFSTFRMLDALGVGATLRPHACRMDRILVTDGRRPGAASRPSSSAFLRFDADEIGDRTNGEPLGYMVENRRIRAALAEAVLAAGVEVRAPVSVRAVEVGPGRAAVALSDGETLQVPLVVGAEGRGSLVRKAAKIDTLGWGYRQSGVVATVALGRDHGNVAHEYFLPDGP